MTEFQWDIVLYLAVALAAFWAGRCVEAARWHHHADSNHPHESWARLFWVRRV